MNNEPMNEKPENPPALPLENKGLHPQQQGMSLRDYFAAAALQGYRAAHHQWFVKLGHTENLADPDEVARWAYEDADAMLKARSV